MIESLILSYVVILWLVFKQVKFTPLNKWTGLTTALLGIFGLTFLILLMNMFQPWTRHAAFAYYTTPIFPQVKGEAIEIPVEANKKLKKGDIPFKIDPTSYQAEVTRLKALLAQNEKDAEMLEPRLSEAQARVERLKAKLTESNQRVEGISAELASAKAAVTENTVKRIAGEGSV